MTGKTNQNGIVLPVSAELIVAVGADGAVHTTVRSAKVGPLPLPANLQEQLTQQIDPMINELINPGNSQMVVESITITDGKLIATGRPKS